MRLALTLMLLFAAGCGVTTVDESGLALEERGEAIDGIVFVHGINGSGSDWDTMVERFKADGWPAERLIARAYSDGKWGCNTRNAEELAQWVDELAASGAQRIAIVAHSMGGLSSRYYLQRLGGTQKVATFITLGTMHHGLFASCLSPVKVCVWQELCLAGDFIKDLNTLPTTPGSTRWVSIFSTGDEIVSAQSSRLKGAHNIQLEGLGHDGPKGLQDSDEVYQRVLESL